MRFASSRHRAASTTTSAATCRWQWDEHNTIGNVAGGSVGMGDSFQSRHQLTRAITGSWNYTGQNWIGELAGSWSHSNNRVRDTAKGFFNSVSVSAAECRTRKSLTSIIRGRASARRRSSAPTGARIDEAQSRELQLTSVNSMPMNAYDQVKEVRGERHAGSSRSLEIRSRSRSAAASTT